MEAVRVSSSRAIPTYRLREKHSLAMMLSETCPVCGRNRGASAGILRACNTDQLQMKTTTDYAVWILVGSLLAAVPKAGAADAGEAARSNKTALTQTASGTRGAVTSISRSDVMDAFVAAYKGDTVTVDHMLRANPALLDAKSLDGRRLLHFAVSSGSTEVVKLLLAYGAAIDSGDLFGLTPLHVAAAMDRVEIAALLIERGASVNVKHRYGKTPLGAAISTNSKKLIALLLQSGGKE
jgi:hypothetical protein